LSIVSVTAEKEGFVITGSNTAGIFLAHKLAEIIVQVSDHADGSSLQVFLIIVQMSIGEKEIRSINNVFVSGCTSFFVWWSELSKKQYD